MIHTVITDALEARTQGQIIQEVHHIPLSVSLSAQSPRASFSYIMNTNITAAHSATELFLACARQRHDIKHSSTYA